MIFICFNKFASFTTIVLILNLDVNYSVRSSSKLTLKGLPAKADASVYLASIARLVQFCDYHRNDIDLNLYFGLFLLNVNLRHVFLKKNTSVPKALNATLNRIMGINGGLIRFFQSMATNAKSPKDLKNKNISFLFRDVDSWARRVEEYALVPNNGMKWRSKKELINKYSSWSVYKKVINSYSTFVPTPPLSDKCLVYLSGNPSKHQRPPYKCFLLHDCYNAVENGTSYGYAITHRLLILLAARYSRGCYVCSPRVDDAVTAKICSRMFDEAQYIAAQGYQHPDLLMEQMGFCGLAGFKEFLQRPWLTNMLRRQRRIGCFGMDLAHSLEVTLEDAPSPWRLAKEGDQMIMGRQCNGHISAVAAGVLGAAVRFIIETYY